MQPKTYTLPSKAVLTSSDGLKAVVRFLQGKKQTLLGSSKTLCTDIVDLGSTTRSTDSVGKLRLVRELDQTH